MADVFISYAREDRARAEQIARGLIATGLDVFWDSEIPPGQTWADYIESKLDAARMVIVLWSEASTKSQWVREEARIGRDKAKLIPVLIDNVRAPFGFAEVQAADLSNWNGDFERTDWTRFVQAVQSAVGAAPAPRTSVPPTLPPQPQAQTGWTTPNNPQQQQSYSAMSGAGAVEQLSPVDYVMKCLRLYADGKGRARRSEYGFFLLFSMAATIAAIVLDILLWGFNSYTGEANGYWLTFLLALALICPTISAASRRAHDFGQSGWLAALTCVPYIGGIIALVFVFIPSAPGANQHGPNPKGQ